MKYIVKIVLLAVAIVSLSSCSITRRSSFSPDRTQLNLAMEDLNYLGELELSINYNQYLGLFKRIESINGVEYDGKKQDSAYANASIFGGGVNADLLLARALPKVFEVYPDADYIIVVGQKKDKEVMFLGSEISVTARVKVYSIK